MPARDRTDAVDWSAVEAVLNGHITNTMLSREVSMRDPSFHARKLAELTRALDAVRLVRAIETASGFDSVSEFLAETAARLREIASMSKPLAAEYARSTAAKLAAVQRALDASKGEG